MNYYVAHLFCIVLALGLAQQVHAQLGKTPQTDGKRSTAPSLEVEEANGLGWSVAGDSNWVFLGEPFGTFDPGMVAIWEWNATTATWTEQDRLSRTNSLGSDEFGADIDVDGNYLLVGAPGVNSGAGAAHIYMRSPATNTWALIASFAGGSGLRGSEFGGAVSIQGDYALIGAYGFSQVRVYRRDAGTDTWSQAGMLTGAESEDGDLFGFGVAHYGDWAMVGAQYADGRQGAVYVFKRDSNTGTWNQHQRITIDDGASNFRFGRSVDMGDGRAVIGEPGRNGFTGSAYIFEYDAATDTWIETRQFDDISAWDVALGGNRVVFGAPFANGNTGTSFVYDYNASRTSWDFNESLSATTNAGSGDQFGRRVAVSGNMVVAGAPGGGSNTAGKAYVFAEDDQGVWSESTHIQGQGITPLDPITGSRVPCSDGMADRFTCNSVDLLSFLPKSDMNGSFVRLSDLWGWKDPVTGKNYALVGRQDGTAFVDVSDPLNPVYIGELPLHEGANPSTWRDFKVYNNYAFVVSDGAGAHGMQIFDLTQLRAVSSPPVTFAETAHYDRVNSAHNIAINEETGYGYIVGGSNGGETCGGGMHIVNIQNPLNPVFEGCFSSSVGRGYSHDIQCVSYKGPDLDYANKEICVGSDEQGIAITDVTVKSAPAAISTATYPNVAYAHQGWFTDDHRYFIQNDELDETGGLVTNTRTLIWDVVDLEDPILIKEYSAPTIATDHNLYVQGSYVYQANYTSGVRILDISTIDDPVEAGFFDTIPGTDIPGFDGAWTAYPYFDSGIVAVSSRDEGLFLLDFTQTSTAAEDEAELPEQLRISSAYPNPFTSQSQLSITSPTNQHISVQVFDMLGRQVAQIYEGFVQAGTAQLVTVEGGSLPSGAYIVRAIGKTYTATHFITKVR